MYETHENYDGSFVYFNCYCSAATEWAKGKMATFIVLALTIKDTFLWKKSVCRSMKI